MRTREKLRHETGVGCVAVGLFVALVGWSQPACDVVVASPVVPERVGASLPKVLPPRMHCSSTTPSTGRPALKLPRKLGSHQQEATLPA